MKRFLTARMWFLFAALSCGSLLSWALYKQHVDFLDPCPLCILQRLAFLWVGVVGLAGAIHGPQKVGQWVYGIILMIGSVTGAVLAGQHVRLQNLPADQVPDCGMGLNYMLDTMPVLDALREVFYGAGECAEVLWTFFGISIPGWSLIWFVFYTLATIFILVFSNRKAERS